MSIAVISSPIIRETRSVQLERAILQTISYADVFDYPLTVPETHRYLTCQEAMVHEVAEALHEMTELGLVQCTDGFFFLPGRESIVPVRRRRAEVADRLWRKAVRYGRLIALLPFVRMVAITGSLSMRNTDWGTDIDLLLVSVPQRLWTCRALVVLVVRLARLDGVTLCPNYIVTMDALEFKERSLYVAHEVAQMIPLSGLDVYCRIRHLNAWTDDYLPNTQDISRSCPHAAQPSGWQRMLEAALAWFPIAWFEEWEMKRKIRQLSRGQSCNPEAEFSAAVCKGHVDGHRQHTEVLLQERLKALTSI